jgi:hypothetical protein
MKTALNILLILGFAAITRQACAQHGDFSDWNVPPPVPPGSMAKGSTPGKATVIVPVADLLPFALPKIAGVKISKLDPVSSIIPDAAVPGQPAYPSTPFLLAEIPLPEIPEAIRLPEQIPQDKASTDLTDIPVPEAPEMPDMPKTPDAALDKFSGSSAKIPATPLIPTQVIPAASTDFPFTECVLPPIPVSLNFTLTLPNSSDNVNPKPKTTQKVKKAPHRNK